MRYIAQMNIAYFRKIPHIYPSVIVRWFVIIGVLGLSLGLGYRSSSQLARLAGFGLAVVPFILLFLRWPPVGLMVLVFASMLVPFSIGTGTQTSLNAPIIILTALLVLWNLDMIVLHQKVRILPSKTFLPLFALVVAAVISFLVGELQWFVFMRGASLFAKIGGLLIILLSVGIYLLIAHQISDLMWLKRITWVFIVFGSIFVIGVLIPESKDFVNGVFQRGVRGSIFWVWFVAICFSQALLNSELKGYIRLLLLVLVACSLILNMGLGRNWASGWLPSLVVILTILLLVKPKSAVVLSIAIFLLGIIFYSQIENFVMAGGQEYSLITRVEAGKILWEIIKVNPLFGLGPANYYWYTQLFPILGWYVTFNSHNQYVDIVAQFGLLGLGFFLWFVWEVWRLGWRLKNKVLTGFPKAYVYGALGGLIGTLAAGMLADWFLPFIYNVGIQGISHSMFAWLFLGGLVSLEFIYLHSQE